LNSVHYHLPANSLSPNLIQTERRTFLIPKEDLLLFESAIKNSINFLEFHKDLL
jgi:hypothetical protein